ncbi:TetR/AcrR family transcriptional regulator [Leisingera sp. ANG-Vp]|uniref:TetR/AcrR family transcriptional regulator n=1 Tax=Leisingera sp. ANG-Vp TaxID=1577896 RepID=UPI000689851B|nr:TetR/AcrR family transcriptional regulator [Leisingera sp. ANG-Vp]
MNMITGMAGLREKQKQLRRSEMLKAAMSLFAAQGYSSVKLEEVAEEAGVSPGTLYTYFKTKNDLLLAVVTEDFEHGFTLGRQVIDAPQADALTAINTLTKCLYKYRMGGPTSEMWRFAVAAFMTQPKSHFAREYEKCLKRQRGQFARLIRRLQAAGLFPEAADADDFVYLLDSAASLSFLEHIRDDEAPDTDLEAKLYRCNEQLLSMVFQRGAA